MRFLAAAVAAMLAAPVAFAAETTMIVAFPAGGATDLQGRLMQTEFQRLLDQPVVIRNIPGAGGTIGAHEASRARPDGATLLLTPMGPLVLQPWMRRLPYDPASFEPICQYAASPLIMMTPPNSPYRTLADLIARAKAQPEAVPYASAGIGTLPHISMVAFTRMAGIRMNHVPFRGSGEVMAAMAANTVEIFSDQSTLVRQYQQRALAQFTAERLPAFPDVPTMRELGHDLVMAIWSGLLAPPGTPEPVLARLERVCAQVLRSEAVVQGFARLDTPIVHRDRAAFRGFIASESERFRDLIAAAGMRQAE
jgi:tripartite-type tricarboxylate transporter receptor subunit TctC